MNFLESTMPILQERKPKKVQKCKIKRLFQQTAAATQKMPKKPKGRRTDENRASQPFGEFIFYRRSASSCASSAATRRSASSREAQEEAPPYFVTLMDPQAFPYFRQV